MLQLVADRSRRTKISHDPNNTTWSRSADTFGHKILTAQGWCPGDFLGAKGASHAKHYTSANASHIRVALKDDNLGLGAKRGSGQAEGQCTGLDAFQGLLGRLNGKSDGALQKEQESRDDLKRAIYSERRWGSVRFIRGGLLIGEKMRTLEDAAAANPRNCATHGMHQQQAACSISQSSRRRQEKDAVGQVTAEYEPLTAGGNMTRKRKSKQPRAHAELNEVDSIEAEALQLQTQLEDDGPSLINSPPIFSLSMVDDGLTIRKDVAQRKEAKAENKRLKAERRATRECKRTRKAECETASMAMTLSETSEPSGMVEDGAKALKVRDPGQTDRGSTVHTQSSATMFSGGRHAVRRRYIQQKKLAMVDAKALSEVRPPSTD